MNIKAEKKLNNHIWSLRRMQTVPSAGVCVCFSRVSDKCDCEQIPVAGAENSSDEVLCQACDRQGYLKPQQAKWSLKLVGEQLGIRQMFDLLWKWRSCNFPVWFWINEVFCAWRGSFFLSRRFLRWAMPPRPQSSATTPATTSSPGWCPRTRTRPRPWWTSSKPCAGTTSPLWLQRETTERAAWTPSSRSPEKTVSA